MKNGALESFNTQNNLVLKSPLTKNRTFQTMISPTEVYCLKIVVDHKYNWSWNLRYDHLNFRSLNQYMVIGKPSLVMPDELCDNCLLGKQSRKSFISTMSMRSFCILEVVHSDVCDSFEDYTIVVNRNFVSFIYEYSQKL